MGWSLGFDDKWNRWVGYGVPAYCDHPKCNKEIDRGLAHVCGGEPYGGEMGCGLYFCEEHLFLHEKKGQVCARCNSGKDPYKRIKHEHPKWIKHLLTDKSWEEWRNENKDDVERLKIN